MRYIIKGAGIEYNNSKSKYHNIATHFKINGFLCINLILLFLLIRSYYTFVTRQFLC